MIQSFFLPILLLLTLTSCTRDKPDTIKETIVVGTVDEVEISETSFQRAYLPVLLYGDKFDSKETRLEVLNFLIGQKLLSETARQAGLDSSQVIQQARDRVEREAMSRQLYQKWVKDQLLTPTEEELRTGFMRGHKSLFVRHLYSKSEEEIRNYAMRLASGGESFYTLAQDIFTDSLLSHNGGSLGWITFGDLDEILEDKAFSLRPGQISEPVKSQYGWHILAVDDTREELLHTEDDYLKTRDLIYNKIVERRENVLGKQVLNDFMEQYKIVFNRNITKQVWPLVIARLETENTAIPLPQSLTESESDLKLLLGETLLTVNGEAWLVSDILRRLPELNRSLLYGNLYIAASNIIRDEMLAREAKKLNLQNHPMVLEEVTDRFDQLLADAYVNLVADTINFSELDQETYFQQQKLQRYHAPDSLFIELFSFADSTRAAKALYQLRNGIISPNPGDQRFWLTAIEQEIPLYKLVRTLSVKTMAGPIFHGGSWVLVKLLDRRRSPLDFTSIKGRVLDDMENERFNTTRNILLDKIRPQHQIKINYDLLNR